MNKTLSDPYSSLDRLSCGRFISYVDNNDYLTFKALFPRRGVMQSFINSIIKEVINHARANSRYSFADPDNEPKLVELIERVKCIIWATGRDRKDLINGNGRILDSDQPSESRSPNPLLNRDSASRTLEGTTSNICLEPTSTPNNPTIVPSKTKQRIRRPKRKAKKSENTQS